MIDYDWTGRRVVKRCPGAVKAVAWFEMFVAVIASMYAIPAGIAAAVLGRPPRWIIDKEFVEFQGPIWVFWVVPAGLIVLYIIAASTLKGRLWAYLINILFLGAVTGFGITCMVRTLTDNQSGYYIDLSIILLLILLSGFKDFIAFSRYRKALRRSRL